MLSIEQSKAPDQALLNVYTLSGAFTDCFHTDIKGSYSQQQFIKAFYSSLLFKLERIILKIVFAKPSTDDQLTALAEGSNDHFAAWKVEKRTENQLLMCDFQSRTRSWLMVLPTSSTEGNNTRLYFGSAVIPTKKPTNGHAKFDLFKLLGGFHKLYSIMLLYSAKYRLAKNLF